MQVNVHTAKTQLSKLIAAVERGEDVVIARGDVPVARLVAMKPERKRIAFGLLAHRLQGPVPDFLKPMSEEELRAWEGDGAEDWVVSRGVV